MQLKKLMQKKLFLRQFKALVKRNCQNTKNRIACVAENKRRLRALPVEWTKKEILPKRKYAHKMQNSIKLCVYFFGIPFSLCDCTFVCMVCVHAPAHVK